MHKINVIKNLDAKIIGEGFIYVSRKIKFE